MCRSHGHPSGPAGKTFVFAAIAYLRKGTSCPAVQNLNLMVGFQESRGLT